MIKFTFFSLLTTAGLAAIVQGCIPQVQPDQQTTKREDKARATTLTTGDDVTTVELKAGPSGFTWAAPSKSGYEGLSLTAPRDATASASMKLSITKVSMGSCGTKLSFKGDSELNEPLSITIPSSLLPAGAKVSKVINNKVESVAVDVTGALVTLENWGELV